jgi:hypothetical protein
VLRPVKGFIEYTFWQGMVDEVHKAHVLEGIDGLLSHPQTANSVLRVFPERKVDDGDVVADMILKGVLNKGFATGDSRTVVSCQGPRWGCKCL